MVYIYELIVDSTVDELNTFMMIYSMYHICRHMCMQINWLHICRKYVMSLCLRVRTSYVYTRACMAHPKSYMN